MKTKLIIALSLLLAMVACTQGSDTVEVGFSGDSEKVKKESIPPCAREENKNSEGCKVVNVSYSGKLKFGPLSLEGEVKNQFYPNGLLWTSSFYPQNRPDAAMLTHTLTYDNEERIHIWETLSDNQPAIVGDGTMDFKNTLTNTYENGKLSQVDGVKEDISPGSNVPNQIFYKTWVPNPVPFTEVSEATWTEEGHLTAHTAVQEATLANNEGLPEEKVYYDYIVCSEHPPGTCDPGQGAKQTKLETVENSYQNNRLYQSTWIKYDCGSGPDLGGAWGKGCISFPGVKVPIISDIKSQNPPKYQEVTSSFDYDDQDRVTRIDMRVDGNLDFPNPGPAVDGTENWHGWCTFEYDDTNPGLTIAKFPEPFKVLGIHDNDKISTITCEDDAGRFGGKLDFKWTYLHEINPDVEGPSNP